VSDIHDALNALAGRGKPRGFDEVLAGATETAEAEAAERDAHGDDLDTIPFVMSEPTARRRRPLGSMIAAAGIAALVLVGAFAVSAVVGSGGAGSAEAAVRRLADAVSHEDPLAAADVLAPDEVRSLHGTLDAAAKKAADLQLVQTASAPLSGVDFNIDGLNLSTESLGDGYAKVTIDAGTFTASTHKKQFSALMQKVLRDSHDNSSQSDLSKLAADKNLPTFVVAVRSDGRWYVSAAYTVLEYVREANQLPAADFGSGLRAVATLGADTPDAAVQDSMRALAAQDWSKLMTMVSPSEIPVYDYRNALTALATRDNNNSSGGSSSSFTIDAMSTNAQVDGNTAKVSLKASGTTDSGKWSLDGGCFTAPNQSVAFPCGPEGAGIRGFAFGGVDQSSQFTVVKQDGRWFVSPVGTVLDALDHFIAQLDRRSLYTLLNIPNQLPPDGRLTLGQPVVLNAANQHLQVLTYDGHKGESLLGQAESTATSKSTTKGMGFDIPANVRVFGPDGTEIGDGGGLLFGQAVTLPTDGTYTVVEESYAFLVAGSDVKVTVWDAADAPASAKQGPGGGCFPPSGVSSGQSLSSSGLLCSSGSSSGETCTYTIGGGRACTSVSAVPAPTIVSNGQVLGPDGKPLIGSGTQPPISFGPNGEFLDPNGTPVTNPDGTPMTVPAALRQTIKQIGQNGGGSYSSSGSAVATTSPSTATHG
jgi:hypothetical protein